MTNILHSELVHPLSLVFLKAKNSDFNFLVNRIANWTGTHMHTCFKLSRGEQICFETRLFCMKLQIEEIQQSNNFFIFCHLGLNDGSEDFRRYQALTLFLLFQVLNKRMSITSAQIKSDNTLIADYFTENRVVYDRLEPEYPISDPKHFRSLVDRLPDI